jgi:hypothetical protein
MTFEWDENKKVQALLMIAHVEERAHAILPSCRQCL